MSKAMIGKLAKNKNVVEALLRLSSKRPLTANEAEVLRRATKEK